MAKDSNAKNLSVFSDVIMSLASDAASDVEGVQVLRSHDPLKNQSEGVAFPFISFPTKR